VSGVYSNVDYYNTGTEAEIKLLQMAALHSGLISVLDDLELTLLFIKNHNRQKLKEMFPGIVDQESYFKYFYENYYIRIATIPDVLGKLGIKVYGLNIKERYSNGKSFIKDHHVKDEPVALILSNIMLLINDLIARRHSKVHSGIADCIFEGFAFMEDYNFLTEEQKAPFNDWTDKDIESELTKMNDLLESVTFLIVDFLNKLHEVNSIHMNLNNLG
jgi:hypothetical protein